jgi:cell division protein FtsI (penicillin-binding protein 3)
VRQETPVKTYPARRWAVLCILAAGAGLLVWRAMELTLTDKAFLQEQGDARYLRVVTVPAHRGMILDRNGEPLAVSTPVDSVWADPSELAAQRERWPALAKLLGMKMEQVHRLLAGRMDREFVYIKRHVHPELASRVKALGITGLGLRREYRRYYPTGEVSAHIVGFTNVDDVGQEGIELAYEDWLRGRPGSKRVVRDRLGQIVEDVESIRAPQAGRDLDLSLDRRIQYLAYRELKAAVKRHRARAGSLVVLDVATGEVLAMVNQPSYNPNSRSGPVTARFRNRAVTDVFEPGSTVKPFTVAAALERGTYSPDSVIDTSPGFFKVGRYTVRDFRNYGAIDVRTVIKKSSNVGASKIALSLPPERLWRTFSDVGFGTETGIRFPGEATGVLTDYRHWGEVRQVTLSYGYGLSVTALQLARAYGVLGADGELRPVSLLRVAEAPPGRRVLSRKIARQVRRMLEGVVAEGGTGVRARVPGYRVAGKTGTVKKIAEGGYAEDRYVAIFAGMAPASRPRLVVVAVVDEPGSEQYYGGQVAAPLFARVMAEALRLLAIPPDDYLGVGRRIAQAASPALVAEDTGAVQ